MVSSGATSAKKVLPILVDSSGRPIVNTTEQYTHIHKHVALTTTNETTVWDPTSDTKFVITDLIVSASAAGVCTIRDGTSGTVIFQIALLEGIPFSHTFRTPHPSATANNNLTAQAGAANQYISVCGYEI